MSTNFEWQQHQVNERINDRLREAKAGRRNHDHVDQGVQWVLFTWRIIKTTAVIVVLAAVVTQML